MEARHRVEFTRGSHAVATIDQMDSANYEAGWDPFVAASMMGSTRSPAANVVVPTTIGSLTAQRIYWKE
jgi:hypothetical protein